MNTRMQWRLAFFCLACSLGLGACGKQQNAQPVAAMPEPPPPVATPAPPSAGDRLQAGLDAVGATHTGRGWEVLLSSATFKPGQTSFEPADTERLAQIKDLLKSNPNVRLLIRAYTDNRGSKSRNQELSQMRANAVLRSLTDESLDGGRIQAQGLGEDTPVATNATAAGRQQNRRVELLFSDAQGQFAPTTGVQARS